MPFQEPEQWSTCVLLNLFSAISATDYRVFVLVSSYYFFVLD